MNDTIDRQIDRLLIEAGQAWQDAQPRAAEPDLTAFVDPPRLWLASRMVAVGVVALLVVAIVNVLPEPPPQLSAGGAGSDPTATPAPTGASTFPPLATPPHAVVSVGDTAVDALVDDLWAAGGEAFISASRDGSPLARLQMVVCVDGEGLGVFPYDTEDERTRIGATINPEDPSRIGPWTVEWDGWPKFWQRDRIIVLYLGSDQATVARLTEIIGPPFAQGVPQAERSPIPCPANDGTPRPYPCGGCPTPFVPPPSTLPPNLPLPSAPSCPGPCPTSQRTPRPYPCSGCPPPVTQVPRATPTPDRPEPTAPSCPGPCPTPTKHRTPPPVTEPPSTLPPDLPLPSPPSCPGPCPTR